MARQFQLRGDTLKHWEEANPVLAEREMVLVATDAAAPQTYDQFKVGDGVRRFMELPYRGLPAVQTRGYSLTEVMSQYAVTHELEGIEEVLQELTGKGGWHEQNTDTGTSSKSFKIHRILLENCHSGLELRNDNDTDYEDLTLKNLYVKGRLVADKGIVETEKETVRTKDNWIVLNDGEKGEGVTAGTAGVKIDRGSALPYFIVFDEEADCLKAGIEGEVKRLAMVADVLESGASAVWDEEKGMFVAGTDGRYLRKERILVLDKLPEDEDGIEDGDIVVVPSDEEETGDMTDFAEEFLRAILKPINAISVRSYRKQGDPDWVDGTIVVSVTAERDSGSDVVVLFERSEDDWGEVVIPEGKKTGETAVSNSLYGHILKVKLKEIVGDDLYIYTVDRDVAIV